MKTVLLILGVTLAMFAMVGCASYEIRGARVYEIENAVEVAGAENKFLIIQYGGFLRGGAGAGGMGAPQVFASSVTQFAELVPEGEPIYTWFEATDYGAKQVYWAFIENRAGLLVWESNYSPSRYRGYCDFVGVTETEIIFRSDEKTWCGNNNPAYWTVTEVEDN